MKISASFLTSTEMITDLKKLNVTDVDYIHVDYMDGKFVPNTSLSFRKLKKIYKYTSKRLDVHIMAQDPTKTIKQFASLNTEFITIHVEIKKDIKKLLDLIHRYGIKAGLAVSPTTDLDRLIPYLDDTDLILVMSVTPGRGGQVFIEETGRRIIELENMLIQRGKGNILISVDGGINNFTKEKVKDVDILVSGSYITSSRNFQENISSLRK